MLAFPSLRLRSNLDCFLSSHFLTATQTQPENYTSKSLDLKHPRKRPGVAVCIGSSSAYVAPGTERVISDPSTWRVPGSVTDGQERIEEDSWHLPLASTHVQMWDSGQKTWYD